MLSKLLSLFISLNPSIWCHPHVPHVTVGDYVIPTSSLGTSLLKTHFLGQPVKSPTRSVEGRTSCDIILWVISATLLVSEWVIILGFPPLVYPSSNWVFVLFS